MKLSNTVS